VNCLFLHQKYSKIILKGGDKSISHYTVGEKLYEDGFSHNYNIDFCKNIINYLREKHKNKIGLHYDTRNVFNMQYKKEIFDLIIDKGTMDTILCNEKGLLNVITMTKEISRVLKVGGIYFILSIGKPEDRLMHLQREHLAFDIQICKIIKTELKKSENNKMNIEQNGDNFLIDNKKIHYAYICKKRSEANERLQNYQNVYSKMEESMQKYLNENGEQKNEENVNVSSDEDNENNENDKSNIVLNINN